MPANPSSGLSTRQLLRIGAGVMALVLVGVALWSGLQESIDERISLPAVMTADRNTGRTAEGSAAADVPPPGTTAPVASGDAAVRTRPAEAASSPPPADEPTSAAAAPAAPVSPGVGPDTADAAVDRETTELMERGDDLMLLSDVSTARQFYLLAAKRGAPSAFTAVAGTYDPSFLQTSGVRGVRGDPTAAIEWYREAMRRGDPTARSRLASLVSHLRATGEIDDAAARRLLDGNS